MKCYNPLYQLYDALHQGEDTDRLIAMCEESANVDDFKCLIGKKLKAGHYRWAESEEKVLDAATAFAAWWQYK